MDHILCSSITISNFVTIYHNHKCTGCNHNPYMPVSQYCVMEENVLLVLYINSPCTFIMLKFTIPFQIISFQSVFHNSMLETPFSFRNNFFHFFFVSNLQMCIYIICSNGSIKEAGLEVML
jgi:hypothetical protein